MRTIKNAIIFITTMIIALESMALLSITHKELPRTVTVISRNEHIIYVYDGNAKNEKDEIVVYDAVLISKKDVSRYTE